MAGLNAELKFEIKKEVGIIGEGTKGWKKEVNFVSWNDRKAKLDIRDWNETHDKMGKGVTLSLDEAKELKHLLLDIEFDDLQIDE